MLNKSSLNSKNYFNMLIEKQNFSFFSSLSTIPFSKQTITFKQN